MAYLFLTGGTGLLGAYLIRDILKAGGNLALLVRSTRKEPAQARIESLMARWEAEDGCEYARPVVLPGDLTAENLGLDASARRWVGRNCDAVMHNAASLTFHSLGPHDEPWKSNLHGTRRVLDLCRETGIRNFHHVSTAYVCGQRMGRILESELDVGQTHGNDYEVSKFRAEVMVRDSDFLDNPTFHRPGIILGDSKTGYTSTFYGFYVPLKLLSSLLTKAAGVASNREELVATVRYTGKRLTEVLNLSDQAGKNYVPVDWVSEVMAQIALSPELHGKTYHLTPDEPVNLKLTREATEATFEKYTELAERKTYNAAEALDFEQFFIEGMKVYAAYWRDDPTFDTTNTRAAAAASPLPRDGHSLFQANLSVCDRNELRTPARSCPRAHASRIRRRRDSATAGPFDQRPHEPAAGGWSRAPHRRTWPGRFSGVEADSLTAVGSHSAIGAAGKTVPAREK